jgi:hypothetical protein
MKTFFVEKELVYDGTQLCSHFAYKNFNISGDSIVGFSGPVNVRLSEMVDIEDVIAKEPILSDLMLNFIIEVFDFELKGLICLQRLFICILKELIEKDSGKSIERKGDDLFFSGRKLSVSIATKSPISGLIHTALNIKNTGTPIPVASLEELNIEPHNFALRAMESFAREYESVLFARTKVNWVK